MDVIHFWPEMEKHPWSEMAVIGGYATILSATTAGTLGTYLEKTYQAAFVFALRLNLDPRPEVVSKTSIYTMVIIALQSLEAVAIIHVLDKS